MPNEVETLLNYWIGSSPSQLDHTTSYRWVVLVRTYRRFGGCNYIGGFLEGLRLLENSMASLHIEEVDGNLGLFSIQTIAMM